MGIFIARGNKQIILLDMHEQTGLLPLLYSFFLGILLALFVGIGVNTFYEAPPSPEYPVELQTSKEFTEEQRQIERTFEASMREYEETLQPYNRNVSIITLVASVLLLVVSMVFGRHLKVIADGIMMGGLFTLIYSIGRGVASGDTKYMFVTISVGLIVVIFLGYRQFIAHDQPVAEPDNR